MENNNIKNRQDKDNTRRKGDKRKALIGRIWNISIFQLKTNL